MESLECGTLAAEPCRLQWSGTPGSSESCCWYHPRNEQFSCNCKTVCLYVGHVWLGRTRRGPNLGGSVGVFIRFCCSILHIFSPVRQKPTKETSASPSSPNRGIHSLSSWQSSSDSNQMGLCKHSCGHRGLRLSTCIWAELATQDWLFFWDSSLLSLSDTFEIWVLSQLSYTQPVLSMEDQPDLSPCGGSRLPLGVPQGSL